MTEDIAHHIILTIGEDIDILLYTMTKHLQTKASPVYEAPDMKIRTIAVETGFASSGPDADNDWGSGTIGDDAWNDLGNY